MSSSYRIELDMWLADLDVKAERVLDIGGAQLPVKGRTRSWDVDEYKILDLPEPHVDSPKPDVTFDLEINQKEALIDIGRADIIFCLEVFDYLIDPLMALANIAWFLLKDGVAYVTFPFIYPTHNPIEYEGLRYTENAVRRLAAHADLKVDDLIRRRPETNLLDQFYRAERMRAAKGYDHEVTGWIATLRRAA